MKKITIITILALLCIAPSAFAGKGYTRNTAPSSCENGDFWIDTDGATGNRFHTCESGVWVLHADKTKAIRYWADHADGTTLAVNTLVAYNGKLYNTTQEFLKTEGATPVGFGAYFEEVSGNYDLPTASAETKGGIKVGARLSIDAEGVLSADVQSGGESITVGDGTTGPFLDGTSDGGTTIKLYGPSTYWTALQAGNALANRSWRLPIDAPPSAGTTRLMNVDEYGQMGLLDPATFLTPTGSAANLTSFPTLNQNTTGTAAGLTAQYIDWSASSGGSSIANKPTIPTTLTSLSDVNAPSPTAGQVMKFDGTEWIAGADLVGEGGTGIAHATSDGKWYGSRNGGWADLTPQFSSAVPYWIDKPVGTSMPSAGLAWYNGQLWKAKTTHNKTSENYPQTPSDDWEVAYAPALATGDKYAPTGTTNGQMLVWATDEWITGTGLSYDNATGDLVIPGEYGTTAADGNRRSKLPFNATIDCSGGGVMDVFNDGGQFRACENNTKYDVILSRDIGQAGGVQGYSANLATAAGITGNSKYFGTNSGGAVGVYDLPSGSVDLGSPGPIGDDTPSTVDATTVTAGEYLSSCDPATDECTAIIPANSGTTFAPGTGKSGFVTESNQLKMYEHGGAKSRIINETSLKSNAAGQKEIGWSVVKRDTATAAAPGKDGATIPVSMQGMNLVDMTCAIGSTNGATGSVTTAALRRVRTMPALGDATTQYDLTFSTPTVTVTWDTGGTDPGIADSDASLRIGDEVYIAGFSTAANNGVFTITGVSANAFTFANSSGVENLNATGVTIVPTKHRDMTSAGVTIGPAEMVASDAVIDTGNDDILLGDTLYVDIKSITTGAAHKGLSCTAVFQAQ